MREVIIISTIVILLCVGVYIANLRFPIFRRQRKSAADIKEYTIRDLDKMKDGEEFEIYLTQLLKRLGYTDAYKTLSSRDFGADIVFTDSEGVRNVIQAKRYHSKHLVGLSAVQEIYTSMRFYKARKAIVITTSTYTNACETLAGVNHVKLIDRNDLIQIIEGFQRDEISKANEIMESEPRIIYETWTEMKEPLKEIRADKKSKLL